MQEGQGVWPQGACLRSGCQDRAPQAQELQEPQRTRLGSGGCKSKMSLIRVWCRRLAPLCLCMVERWCLSLKGIGPIMQSPLPGPHGNPTSSNDRLIWALGIWGRHNSARAGVCWASAGPVLRPCPESPVSLGSKCGKDWGPGAWRGTSNFERQSISPGTHPQFPRW